jgi:hypothetical protein
MKQLPHNQRLPRVQIAPTAPAYAFTFHWTHARLDQQVDFGTEVPHDYAPHRT